MLTTTTAKKTQNYITQMGEPVTVTRGNVHSLKIYFIRKRINGRLNKLAFMNCARMK